MYNVNRVHRISYEFRLRSYYSPLRILFVFLFVIETNILNISVSQYMYVINFFLNLSENKILNSGFCSYTALALWSVMHCLTDFSDIRWFWLSHYTPGSPWSPPGHWSPMSAGDYCSGACDRCGLRARWAAPCAPRVRGWRGRCRAWPAWPDITHHRWEETRGPTNICICPQIYMGRYNKIEE